MSLGKCSASALFLILLLAGTATASLELGSGKTIALNREWTRYSLGIGLGLKFVVADRVSSYTFESGDVVVITPYPVVTFRRFTKAERSNQPFVVVRVSRGIPIIFTDSDHARDSYRESEDDWIVDVGGGIRTSIGTRLMIGGDAVLSTRVATYGGRTDVLGGSGFGVFLQYHH